MFVTFFLPISFTASSYCFDAAVGNGKEHVMHGVRESYRGVSLLLGLHADLLLFGTALFVALVVAGYLGTL